MWFLIIAVIVLGIVWPATPNRNGRSRFHSRYRDDPGWDGDGGSDWDDGGSGWDGGDSGCDSDSGSGGGDFD